MAYFLIIHTNGLHEDFEGTLNGAFEYIKSLESGTRLEIKHPGTSGHGTAGLDY